MPKWLQWSAGYPLLQEQVTLEHKNIPISGSADCILQYFAKKPCGGGPVKNYDYSLVLELHLKIENQFWEEVCEFREQEPNVQDTGR